MSFCDGCLVCSATQGKEGEWKALQLIAFTDRSPADRKAKRINSIALHSTTRSGQTQTQGDCITHGFKSGGALTLINIVQTYSIFVQITISIYFSFALQYFVQSVPTSDRPTQFFFSFFIKILDLSLQVALHPLSEQTEQQFAPLPPCHWGQTQTLCGLLTRPTRLPGICSWVIELTFIKGSYMETPRELTVLLSRCTPEFRRLCSTHPSLFPTIKETMKQLSSV